MTVTIFKKEQYANNYALLYISLRNKAMIARTGLSAPKSLSQLDNAHIFCMVDVLAFAKLYPRTCPVMHARDTFHA